VNKVFLVLILLLSSCSPVENNDLFEQYGEHYFSMDCSWAPPEANDGIWWCEQHVATDLISGYIVVSLRTLTKLAICGEGIELNSGYDLHDQLIPYLTRDEYKCINAVERELGNEFDWLWDREINVLQLIWRESEENQKILTLIIENGEPDKLVKGEVYYKEVWED